MKVWTNTNTLNGLIDDLEVTQDKHEAEIALLGGKTLDLNEFPKLKGIFRAGIGKDNVPEELAAQRYIKCCYPSKQTIEVILEETANFACHFILKAAYEKVGTLDPWIKLNRSALHTKKLLIIGFGNIGKKVASKMKPFLEVVTYDSSTANENFLIKNLPKADFISLHIPSSKDNNNFLDAKRLKLLKDNACIINTARGNIVNEDALYEEIKIQRLSAYFDVYWQEPYFGKLKEFNGKGFYMTPHVASTCNEFLEGCANDLKNFIKDLQHA